MKISIVMTSYNYADYIVEAIDSILAQSYEHWELIIVDDGSSDNSIEIIKKYNDDRIKLFTHCNNQNKGLKESLLLGLKVTSADYIAFLESDDYWHKDYLQSKVNILEQSPDIKFIFNSIEPFGDKEVLEKYYKNTADNIENDIEGSAFENYFYAFFNKSVVATFSSVLVNKKVLMECDFNTPYDPFLDWWLYHQISIKHKFYCINKKLTFWRMHKKSYTFEKYENQKKIEQFYKKLFKNYILNFNNLNVSLILKLQILIYLIIRYISSNLRINKIFRGLIRDMDIRISEKVKAV